MTKSNKYGVKEFRIIMEIFVLGIIYNKNVEIDNVVISHIIQILIVKVT